MSYTIWLGPAAIFAGIAFLWWRQIRSDRNPAFFEREIAAFETVDAREMPVLDRNVFVIRKHVGLLKVANNYDILDPTNGQVVMHCREGHMGVFTKLLRLLPLTPVKHLTPFHIEIRTPEGQPVVAIKRGTGLPGWKLRIYNHQSQYIGCLQQNFVSRSYPPYTVLDANGQPFCRFSGDWAGWWNVRLLSGEVELAHLTNSFSTAASSKELFSTEDKCVLNISGHVPAENPARQLILAATIGLDMSPR